MVWLLFTTRPKQACIRHSPGCAESQSFLMTLLSLMNREENVCRMLRLTHYSLFFSKELEQTKTGGIMEWLMPFKVMTYCRNEHLPTSSTLVCFYRAKIRLSIVQGCKHFFLTLLRFAFLLQKRSLDLCNNWSRVISSLMEGAKDPIW